MELCSATHPEICHEEHYCPLCDAMEMIAQLKEENADLHERLDDLLLHPPVQALMRSRP